MARIKDDATLSWPAVSSAIGLLTSLRARSGDSQAEIIGGQDLGQVVTALAIISTALLEGLTPDAGGDRFLRQLGLAALEHSTESGRGTA